MGATPLRERIRDALLDDLVEGRLDAEDRIGVAPLAERFDVSLTPAREALTQLEAEGWVVLRPNRGFFAAPMTIEEAEYIYPVVGALEELAIELQPEVSPERRAELRRLNEELRAAADEPDRAFELDRLWHETLTEGCGNPILLKHLRSLRKRAERYDRAYMRHSGRIPISTEDHDRIIEALESAPDEVGRLVRENWMLSLHFVREWRSEP
ncbi:MAG: GntR family transcriptional regulator [Gemmatimonadota bacterium]